MKLVIPKQRPNPLTYKIFMDELKGFQNEPNALKEFLENDGTKESLIDYHHSYGRYIRNTYIYPNKEEFMSSYPNEHIDDISFEIIMNIHEMMKSVEKYGEDLYTFGNENVKQEKGNI